MGVGEIAETLGTRNGHVEQTTLFLQLARVEARLLAGEEVVFQAGDEDGVEFQAFGGMNRHERHARCAVVLLVAVGLQRTLLQKLGQRDVARGDRLLAFLVGLAVALESTHGAEQFFHVFAFTFAFRPVFLVEVGSDARGVDDVESQVEGADIEQTRTEFENEVAKRLDLVECAFGELHPVLCGLFGHRPQTDIVFARGGENLLQGGGADAARGVVHHAFEGFLVVEIGDQAEVGDDVLDLFALIERHATVDAVGDVVFAQGIFERTALGVGAVENGDLIVGHFFAAVQSTDCAGHFCGLFLVGRGRHHENLFAGIVLAVHRFFDLFFVVADDAVGRAHNVLR